MAMNGQSPSGLAGFARLPLCMTSRGLCASHTPPRSGQDRSLQAVLKQFRRPVGAGHARPAAFP
mgnify:CR=1 FL=1